MDNGGVTVGYCGLVVKKGEDFLFSYVIHNSYPNDIFSLLKQHYATKEEVIYSLVHLGTLHHIMSESGSPVFANKEDYCSFGTYQTFEELEMHLRFFHFQKLFYFHDGCWYEFDFQDRKTWIEFLKDK